jgi:tetratricopeptide (TPR) repeat protein
MLVPAKCTECGAASKVDTDKKAAVCEYCGNAFIVGEAVSNFTNSHFDNVKITDSTVNIAVQLSQSETLKAQAKRAFDAGFIEDAIKQWKLIINIDKTDYESYWNLALYEIHMLVEYHRFAVGLEHFYHMDVKFFTLFGNKGEQAKSLYRYWMYRPILFDDCLTPQKCIEYTDYFKVPPRHPIGIGMSNSDNRKRTDFLKRKGGFILLSPESEYLKNYYYFEKLISGLCNGFGRECYEKAIAYAPSEIANEYRKEVDSSNNLIIELLETEGNKFTTELLLEHRTNNKAP